MADEKRRGEGGKGAGRFLGSLREALAAAGREEQAPAAVVERASPAVEPARAVIALPAPAAPPSTPATPLPAAANNAAPAPAERASPVTVRPDRVRELASDAADPPTTRVVRGAGRAPSGAREDRTELLRGRQKIRRGQFHQDPVVGWLVVVGGPGLGAYRPVFEGNNTLGRASSQRIPIDFGDDSISSEEQAYIRYDSAERSFLFVPNLAKTNVVSINDRKPTTAVPLAAMDVITMGRTQLVFMPFCGPDFDWSELTDTKV